MANEIIVPAKELPKEKTTQHFTEKEVKDVEEFWDNQATLPGYQSVVVDDDKHTSTRMLYNFLRMQLDFQDKRVLDLGCGVGRLFPILLEAGVAEIHGVDFSTNMVRIARFKHPNPNIFLYRNNLIHLYDVPNNHFDVVLAVTVMCHMLVDEHIEQVAKEIDEVTRSDGIVLICEPMSVTLKQVYNHSKMTIRPYTFYEDIFGDRFELIFRSRECFGPSDHIDSWRTVMIFQKE